MSDDDPRVFEPLAPGHPALWEPCGICGVTFIAGDVTMLVPKERWTPGSGMTVEGALVHRRCYETAGRVLGHRTPETLDSFMIPSRQSGMTRIREHRGSLADSMETLRTVATKDELVRIVQETFAPFGVEIKAEQIHVKPYVYDGRIAWDTHIVVIDGYGVWGMADGPLD